MMKSLALQSANPLTVALPQGQEVVDDVRVVRVCIVEGIEFVVEGTLLLHCQAEMLLQSAKGNLIASIAGTCQTNIQM